MVEQFSNLPPCSFAQSVIVVSRTELSISLCRLLLTLSTNVNENRQANNRVVRYMVQGAERNEQKAGTGARRVGTRVIDAQRKKRKKDSQVSEIWRGEGKTGVRE